MQQGDLKQISDLLDQKFDQKFEENNKTLKEELKGDFRKEIKENNKTLKEEIVDEIGALTNHAFGEHEKGMETKIKESEKRMETKIKESEKRTGIKITNSHEEIMTEIKTIKQEQTVNLAAHDRIDARIDEHALKIAKLEKQRA